MTERTCAECGQPVPEDRGRFFCSDACAKADWDKQVTFARNLEREAENSEAKYYGGRSAFDYCITCKDNPEQL